MKNIRGIRQKLVNIRIKNILLLNVHPDIFATDDFASNIEKAIASVLKKDKNQMDQDNDDKRGKKRKKDKNRKRVRFLTHF